MDYAAQRLDQGRHRRLQRCCYLDRIHRRHGNKLGEPARQSGDAVLAIELTLMTILSATILTKNLAPPADAIQSLVHHDAIAFTQISNRATYLFYDAGNFVTKNLRLYRQRDLLTIFVCIVVCMTGKDVRIGSTQTDRGHANQHFIRRDRRLRGDVRPAAGHRP